MLTINSTSPTISLPNLTSGEDTAVVNTSAFERLYWPILDKEGISNIRVADKENNTSSSSRASFTNHPVALEPATVTNASKIFVTAECLACKEGEWNDGFEGQPEGVERLEDAWDYFVIETADGSPVLVRDVVAQVHAWAANPFIGDKIREGMVWMYNASFERGEDGWCSIGVGCEDDVDEVPEGTKIFFEHFFEHGPDQDTGVPVVSIEFWVEGWMGNSAEYFWKSRGDPELQYGL
ncbi:unnamed protein product [Alternaria alternata]